MELEVARPRVEDGGDAEARAEAGGIERERAERPRGGAEQAREEAAAVAEREGTERGREREDDVEVVAREEPRHPRLDPPRLAERLTLADFGHRERRDRSIVNTKIGSS
jgi:hypothetical protein